MGETLFSGFCWIWIVTGSLLLLARAGEGLRRLEQLKNLKIVEHRLLDDVEHQIRNIEREIEAVEGDCAEARAVVAMNEKRLTDLARKRNFVLRLSGRELPSPSERLWVAAYVGGEYPRFGATWADDESQARTKLISGLGQDFGQPGAVVTVNQFKSSMLS